MGRRPFRPATGRPGPSGLRVLLLPFVILALAGAVAPAPLPGAPGTAANPVLCPRVEVEGGASVRASAPLRLRGVEFTDELVSLRLLPRERDRLARARELESLARSALEEGADPIDARWAIIAAMAAQVDEESTTGKVRVTRRIVDELEVLEAAAPGHPGVLHATGRLHAGVMRMSGVLRWAAGRLVGGELLRSASWEEAERQLRAGAEREPCALHHRFELAQLLADRGRTAEAAEELEALLALPVTSLHDAHFRERALELQASLAAAAGRVGGL